MEIRIENLTKIYKGGTKAISDINLVIEDGMFGLLGPNGAGKSTLMRILVTLMKPSSGKVLVNGMDLQKNRKQVRTLLGYLPQDFRFFAKYRTWEFLDYSARLAGLKDRTIRNREVERMLEQVGLFEARDRSAGKLSGGMKRRLGIAQALIGDPKIVIVDEPTTGLDPIIKRAIHQLIRETHEKFGFTAVIVSHEIPDIFDIAQNAAMLFRGEILQFGSADEIRNSVNPVVKQFISGSLDGPIQMV